VQERAGAAESFGQAVEQQLGSKKSDRKKMLADHQAGDRPSLHGNILDLVAKRERKMNQGARAHRNTSHARTEKGDAPKYF
jgi:hypothetical protein